jgi:hypothetical protein
MLHLEHILAGVNFKIYPVCQTVAQREYLMGRRLLKTLVSLLVAQSMFFSSYAQAAGDGLKPQIPKIDVGNKSGSDPNLDDPPEILPAPGTGGPRKPLIRPDNSVRGYRVDSANIKIADVSEEFACPLFESKAYETIMDSLDKLSDAMKSTTQCNPNQTMTNAIDNTNKIRDAINQMRPYFDKPETAYGNIKDVEDGISKAVQGVDGITQSLASPSFTNSDCGSNLYRGTGFASTVTSLITSMGPFALLAVSVAPGLSVIVKTAALAIVAGASAFNEYQKVTYGRTLDMRNHDQWKGVVQNTCAYSRVVRKLNYIERYESGLIPAVEQGKKNTPVLPVDVQRRAAAFEQMYAGRTDRLGQYIKMAQVDKKNFDDMTQLIQAGRIEISRYVSQIGSSKTNPEIACSVGLEIARLAKNQTGFPNSLVNSIDVLKQYKDQVDDQSYSGLLDTYQRLIQGLLLLRNDSLTNSSAVNDCAAKTMSLLDVLGRTSTIYDAILNGIANDRDAQLMKDADYRKWKAEFSAVEDQKKMGVQLYRVMKNVSNSSSILKSLLNRRQNDLRQILFGQSNWLGSKPPVALWLDYTLTMHQDAATEYMKNINYLRVDLYNLKTRQLSIKPVTSSYAANLNFQQAMQSAANLEGLDIRNFNMKDPLSVREQQLVCNRLLNIWDTWIQAVNHLDSVGVFCDMIDPLIDVATDKSIVKFCRGSDIDIRLGPVATSRVSEAAKILQTPILYMGGKSMEQLALAVPGYVRNMNCDVSGGR